jgi:hypothetical protein
VVAFGTGEHHSVSVSHDVIILISCGRGRGRFRPMCLVRYQLPLCLQPEGLWQMNLPCNIKRAEVWGMWGTDQDRAVLGPGVGLGPGGRSGMGPGKTVIRCLPVLFFSTNSAASNLRSVCGVKRSPPVLNSQRFPIGALQVGQATEDSCFLVSCLRFMQKRYGASSRQTVPFGTVPGRQPLSRHWCRKWIRIGQSGISRWIGSGRQVRHRLWTGSGGRIRHRTWIGNRRDATASNNCS